MLKKIAWISVSLLILAVTASGWIYSNIDNQSDKDAVKMLNTTFVQQYGNQAIVKEMVAPEQVYAALWTDPEGVSHVSWNIGGLWVTVWNSSQPTPAP